MFKLKALTLTIFVTIPLITGCQSLDLTESQKRPTTSQVNINASNEPFLRYPLSELEVDGLRFFQPIALMAEFRYVDGCLLVFNGVQNELVIPAFPEGDAQFNVETQTLKLLDTEYKMGEVVIASGRTDLNNTLKNDLLNINVPSKCITEQVAIFYAGYKKTTWN